MDGKPLERVAPLAGAVAVCAAVAAMAGFALERKQTGAIGVAALVIGGSLVLRSPWRSTVRPWIVPPPSGTEGLCGSGSGPHGPVRVAVWTVGRLATDTGSMRCWMKPDIVVLRGPTAPAWPCGCGRTGGEAKVSATPTGGLITVTRGNFQYCGGEEDAWTFDLPSRSSFGGRGELSVCR